MNLLRTLANSNALRLLLGGTLSGAATYAFVYTYQPIIWITVPAAAFIGAMSCLIWDTLVEAIFKAILASIMAYLLLELLPGMLARDPSWWESALPAILIGFFIGAAIGSIFGAISRCISEQQPPHTDSDIQKHQ